MRSGRGVGSRSFRRTPPGRCCFSSHGQRLRTTLRNAKVAAVTNLPSGRQKREVRMRRLVLLIGGVLLLGACASGPVVGGGFADDQAEEAPAGGEHSTSAVQSDDEESGVGSTSSPVGIGSQSSDPAMTGPADSLPSSEAETLLEPNQTPTTQPPKTSASTELPPPTTVEFAVADLAGRAAVASASVRIVSVEEVTWPDGSLGCPDPGMSYTQSLVNGSRVVLESGGILYEYHSGPDGELFYCPTPTPPVEGSGYGDV